MIFQDKLDVLIENNKRLRKEIQERKDFYRKLNKHGIYSDKDLLKELAKAIDAYTQADPFLKQVLKEAIYQWEDCADCEGFNYISEP